MYKEPDKFSNFDRTLLSRVTVQYNMISRLNPLTRLPKRFFICYVNDFSLQISGSEQNLRQNRIFRLNRLNFISDVKCQVTKKKGCYVFPGEDCNWSGDPVPLSSSEMGVFVWRQRPPWRRASWRYFRQIELIHCYYLTKTTKVGVKVAP